VLIMLVLILWPAAKPTKPADKAVPQATSGKPDAGAKPAAK
jgi:hypothetical protein